MFLLERSVHPNLQSAPGTHAPYAFRCGKDEESARHATVAMRLESYDANWGYFTQVPIVGVVGYGVFLKVSLPCAAAENGWAAVATAKILTCNSVLA